VRHIPAPSHRSVTNSKAHKLNFADVAIETATHRGRIMDGAHFLTILYFPYFLQFFCLFTGAGPNSSIIATAIASRTASAVCAWRLLLFPRIENVKSAPRVVVA
jgi:hypothetical protein